MMRNFDLKTEQALYLLLVGQQSLNGWGIKFTYQWIVLIGQTIANDYTKLCHHCKTVALSLSHNPQFNIVIAIRIGYVSLSKQFFFHFCQKPSLFDCNVSHCKQREAAFAVSRTALSVLETKKLAIKLASKLNIFV